MRLLVGTLYAGESEFDECVAAIAAQSHPHVEQFVLRDLGEMEAHDALYRTFMERAGDVELFVKVDADLVIESRQLFARIAERMSRLPEVDQMSIAVDDFFSGLMLLGLHVYRSHVRWPPTDDRVFPDRREAVPRERRLVDRDDLAPAALHCKAPGDYQSFRFGLHRGVKLVELERRRMYPSRSPDVRQRTWERFLGSGDIRRGWASLGFELAISGSIGVENRDYRDPIATALWEQHRHLPERELPHRIERLRAENTWLQESFDRQASTGASSGASSSRA
jgi:hypothetical protein